jgi:hypothetical protein
LAISASQARMCASCGIAASGGTLVVQDVADPAARWRDLSAFARCVEAATRQLASPSSA